jgi:ABC-type branched-subunit amino acid transport system substrate-binding protein
MQTKLSADAEKPKRKESNMRMFKPFVVPVVALAMLAGSFGAVQAAPDTVKIGNIIPLSGPSASVGIQGKQARQMAVDEINSASRPWVAPSLNCCLPTAKATPPSALLKRSV